MRHTERGTPLETIHPIGTSSWEGHLVKLDKGVVAAALRRQGDHDRAQQAECLLPRQVDTQRDAGLLHRLDVDLSDLDDGRSRADST